MAHQQQHGNLLEAEKTRTKPPPMYKVMLLNDDYTPMEFVVLVLINFFRKDPTEAHHLMLKVHMLGKAVVAVYTRDIAETKVQQVEDFAREQEADKGYDLERYCDVDLTP